MSKGNRVPGSGSRYDKWTPSAIEAERALNRDRPPRLQFAPMGQKLCVRCKNRKPIKGGSQRPNSIGVLAFTCADCKAKTA